MAKLNKPLIKESVEGGGGDEGSFAKKKFNPPTKKSFGNKKKSFKSKKGFSDDGGIEALDIDIADDKGLDTKEISDFVKKLGLAKFNTLSPSKSSKKAPSNKSSVNVASITSNIAATPATKDKLKKKKKNLTNGKKGKVEEITSSLEAIPSAEVEEGTDGNKIESKKKKKKGKDKKPMTAFYTSNTSNPIPKPTNHEPPKDKVFNQARGEKDEKQNKFQKKNKGDFKNKDENTFQQPKMKMLITSEGKWFEEEPLTQKTPEESEATEEVKLGRLHLRKEEIGQFRKTAEDLLDSDTKAYKASNLKTDRKSDFQWMEKMMKNGTLPDKMAAFIVRIQDSPIHNLNYLQSLIAMVKVQGKQQCLITADTVKELFLEDLLPPGRKLIPFENRGSTLQSATKTQLIKWLFEDNLKFHYQNFVEALRKMASDTVEKLRGKGLAIIHQLLAAHPELEDVLLQILVNKLGDPAKKMGSRALYYLQQLLEEHPKMKKVVIEEVERLLFRNNISTRAQYYGICFLNVIKLDGEHASLGHKLITLYLAFFKACIKTGDIDTKMMSGLLTGINRAFPSAQEYGFQFTESLDTLYMIIRLSQFAIGVQAMSILFQVINVATNPTGADRFYRVLYEKLLTPEFITTSHNMQFLNLIFKAMKADIDLNRVISFTKRLLQISQTVPPNLACAILFLISEVVKTHPGSLRIEELSSSEIELKAASESEELILSDSETEEDKNLSQQKAKSLENLMKSTNISLSDPVADQVNEEQSGKKKKKKSSKIPLKSKSSIESSDTATGKLLVPAYFPEEEKDKLLENTLEIQVLDSVSVISKSTTEDEVKIKEDLDIKPDIKRIITKYDPLARNPSYAGSELVYCYELMALAQHFHPSVALFAQALIKKKPIVYDGNPLKDFTLSRFLERFVYRNAKPSKPNRPEYRPKGLRNVPVNSKSYLKANEDNIPPEERFFYKFFTDNKKDSTGLDANIIKEEKDEDISDTESIGDDEFDKLMGNYFKSVKAGGEGAESDDDDEELNDEDGIDFAAGISSSVGKKGKKRKIDEEDDDDEMNEEDGQEEGDGSDEGDDDADDFINLDEDEGDFDDEEGFEGDGDDDDDEGMFEDDEEDMMPTKAKRMKKSLKGIDMFAPADQFAEMLEENADDNFGGSHTLINKERADPKQLKWETQKDRWIKGYPNSSKQKFKGGGGQKKRFGKKFK